MINLKLPYNFLLICLLSTFVNLNAQIPFHENLSTLRAEQTGNSTIKLTWDSDDINNEPFLIERYVEDTRNFTTIADNVTGSNGNDIRSISVSYISSIIIGSSIISSNSISNTQSPTIISNGYNVFTNNPSGANGVGDQVNVSLNQINLLPLAYYGGATQTMLPGLNSIAIDQGDPSDFSVPQNVPVYGGRRDVGVSETSC